MTDIYIHYGHPFYNKDFVNKIENVMCFVKPYGGLWASRVNAKYGWYDWCTDNEFRLDKLNTHFKFVLTDDARVVQLRSVDDIYTNELPQLHPIIEQSHSIYLDFEKCVSIGIDAIEVTLDTDNKPFWDTLRWALYGWDCDSILILNPEIVCPISDSMDRSA